MLPVSEIAAEIAKSLDFLETEMGDVPDRHRSLRAVFEYSWALLSSEERTTFLALSVFRGGFTREAAEAVAGASLRSLSTLANKSLIAPSPETGRYAVHELLAPVRRGRAAPRPGGRRARGRGARRLLRRAHEGEPRPVRPGRAGTAR